MKNTLIKAIITSAGLALATAFTPLQADVVVHKKDIHAAKSGHVVVKKGNVSVGFHKGGFVTKKHFGHAYPYAYKPYKKPYYGKRVYSYGYPYGKSVYFHKGFGHRKFGHSRFGHGGFSHRGFGHRGFVRKGFGHRGFSRH